MHGSWWLRQSISRVVEVSLFVWGWPFVRRVRSFVVIGKRGESRKTRVCPSQRELESLFDRYDEDCSNTIDYKNLCDHIFEMGEHIAMNSTSRSMIERVSEGVKIYTYQRCLRGFPVERARFLQAIYM